MDIIRARSVGEDKAKFLPYISIIVKEERIKLGLRQVDLAQKVGIGLKVLRKIEQGDLNVNFIKLNFLLNCLGLYLKPSELVVSPAKKADTILSQESILRVLKSVYPIFQIKYGVKSLALFGSYAKNFQGQDSDIDVLISFKDDVGFEVEGEIQLILENLFSGTSVDLTVEDNLHPTLEKEIKETRIEIK